MYLIYVHYRMKIIYNFAKFYCKMRVFQTLYTDRLNSMVVVSGIVVTTSVIVPSWSPIDLSHHDLLLDKKVMKC